MRKLWFVVPAAVAVIFVATRLDAQPVQTPPAGAQDRVWSAAFSAGLTSSAPGSGAALGGSMVLDMTDRLAVEVAGGWLDRGRGSDGVTLGGSLLVNLLPQAHKAVPFVAMGAAVVRTSFNMDDPEFLGRMSGQFGPGAIMVPFHGARVGGMMQGTYMGPGRWTGTWTAGPTVDLSSMPMFYQQRLDTMQMGPNGRWGMQSFTDPALNVGGGVRFNVSERFYVRPDARALIVLSDGDTHTFGTFTVSFGTRF